MNKKDETQDTLDNTFNLIICKLIGLTTTLMWIVFFLFVFLMLLFLGANYIDNSSVTTITTEIIRVWQTMAPMISSIFSMVVPLLGLIATLWFLSKLVSGKKLSELFTADSIPSVLAIIVITVVCVLPLIGREIPREIGSIALVVIGFYFGRNIKNNN